MRDLRLSLPPSLFQLCICERAVEKGRRLLQRLMQDAALIYEVGPVKRNKPPPLQSADPTPRLFWAKQLQNAAPSSTLVPQFQSGTWLGLGFFFVTKMQSQKWFCWTKKKATFMFFSDLIWNVFHPNNTTRMRQDKRRGGFWRCWLKTQCCDSDSFAPSPPNFTQMKKLRKWKKNIETGSDPSTGIPGPRVLQYYGDKILWLPPWTCDMRKESALTTQKVGFSFVQQQAVKKANFSLILKLGINCKSKSWIWGDDFLDFQQFQQNSSKSICQLQPIIVPHSPSHSDSAVDSRGNAVHNSRGISCVVETPFVRVKHGDHLAVVVFKEHYHRHFSLISIPPMFVGHRAPYSCRVTLSKCMCLSQHGENSRFSKDVFARDVTEMKGKCCLQWNAIYSVAESGGEQPPCLPTSWFEKHRKMATSVIWPYWSFPIGSVNFSKSWIHWEIYLLLTPCITPSAGFQKLMDTSLSSSFSFWCVWMITEKGVSLKVNFTHPSASDCHAQEQTRGSCSDAILQISSFLSYNSYFASDMRGEEILQTEEERSTHKVSPNQKSNCGLEYPMVTKGSLCSGFDFVVEVNRSVSG